MRLAVKKDNKQDKNKVCSILLMVVLKIKIKWGCWKQIKRENKEEKRESIFSLFTEGGSLRGETPGRNEGAQHEQVCEGGGDGRAARCTRRGGRKWRMDLSGRRNHSTEVSNMAAWKSEENQKVSVQQEWNEGQENSRRGDWGQKGSRGGNVQT